MFAPKKCLKHPKFSQRFYGKQCYKCATPIMPYKLYKSLDRLMQTRVPHFDFVDLSEDLHNYD